jgi:hypothetical protein
MIDVHCKMPLADVRYGVVFETAVVVVVIVGVVILRWPSNHGSHHVCCRSRDSRLFHCRRQTHPQSA